MPWLSEAMKDATSCDKLRVDANNLQSAGFRMGQPDYVEDIVIFLRSQPDELKHLSSRRKRKQ